MRGVGALTELATGRATADDRMSAIGCLVDCGVEDRAVSLLEAIVATDAEAVRMRDKAATKLASIRPELAVSAYTTLVQDTGIPTHRRADFAVKVAQTDRQQGSALLRQIAATAPADQALAVIERLEQLDRTGAAAEYRRVAALSGVGSRTRLSATNRAARLVPAEQGKSRTEDDVSHLSRRRQLQARVAQAGDRKLKPEERFTAVEAVAKLNPGQGKNLLQAMIDDRKTPKAVRVKAEKALRKLR